MRRGSATSCCSSAEMSANTGVVEAAAAVWSDVEWTVLFHCRQIAASSCRPVPTHGMEVVARLAALRARQFLTHQPSLHHAVCLSSCTTSRPYGIILACSARRGPRYSRGIRQRIYNESKTHDWRTKYNIHIDSHGEDRDIPYTQLLSSSVFCLAVPGAAHRPSHLACIRGRIAHLFCIRRQELSHSLAEPGERPGKVPAV